MYEKQLFAKNMGPRTANWNELMSEKYTIENEELLLRNTFLNAQIGPFADFSKSSVPKGKKKRKIRWIDQATGKKVSLYRELEKSKDIIYMKKVKKVNSHKVIPASSLQSINKANLGQQGPF